MSNKTSDKNVANIEEDIELVKRYLENSAYKKSNSDFFKNGGWEMVDLEIPKAMANILAEREQMLKERDVANDSVIAHKFAVMQQQINEKDKRIQELEEESRKKSIELICYQEELENSIANLAELEQKDKRIKELEEEKVELKEYNKIVSDRIVEYKKNSIPKQAVIDKIKEYDKKMEEDAGHPNWVVTDRIVMNVLQELLETK